MSEKHSFINNELLAGIAILSVLNECKKMEVTKVLLIYPLLSYRSVREFVKKDNINCRSIEELIIKRSITFTNFNKRYIDNFMLSINAIFLMQELKLVRRSDTILEFTGEKFQFDNKDLGKKAKEMIKAAKNISTMLKEEEVSNLYLSLRIEL